MTTALIIEDNDDNLVLISYLLQREGYELLAARTGEAGVEMALKHKPDLVILDIQLPGIDGYEVLKRIRASEDIGSTTVIAMTSFAMSGDRERLLSAGCDGYIEKPIDPTAVIKQIKTVLEKAQQR